MSFVAAIDNPLHLVTWARCCVSLAAVAESLQLTCSAAGLVLTAVSASRTTHAEVAFHPSFFCSLAFSTADCLPDFVQRDHAQRPCFSLVVAARHLLVLFRHLDAADVNYICLQLDHTAPTPPQRLHKLTVEILTKKNVLKKYQINHHPAACDAPDIPRSYRARLAANNVNHFRVETAVLRSFFELVPVATEDFEIDVRATKIEFAATTRSASKDSSLAKQPMSITVQMAVDELEDSNLADGVAGVRARLRDTRNFVTLISSVKTASADDAAVPAFDVLFLSPGEPLLLQYATPHMDVCFVQMTLDHTGSYSKKQQYALRGPVLANERRFDLLPASDPPAGDSLPRVGIGLAPAQAAQKRSLEDDTDYSSEEDFGPTQRNAKPQSLFD